MRNVQRVIGVVGVMLYGLFSPVLTQAQEANDPAALPAAVERSESDAVASVLDDVEVVGEDAEKALKNEAQKDAAQLNDRAATPTVMPASSLQSDDSLESMEESERSLEALSRALDQVK